MKIAYLCNSPKISAGVERNIYQLAIGLTSHNIHARFFFLSDCEFSNHLSNSGHDIKVCDRKILSKEIVTYSPDVIQLHLSRLWAKKLKRLNIPIIERLNMSRNIPGFFPTKLRLYDLYSSKWINKFICVSHSIKDEFVGRGYPVSKLSVIHNGVHQESKKREKLSKHALGINPDKIIIGFIGRVTKQKNIEFLLSCVEDLETKNEFQFLIVGDGELKPILQNKFSNLIEKGMVKFFPFQKKPIEWISMFDILAYPSTWEPFSNTILEALSIGTPIVASDVGGNQEAIKHGHNGLLFDLNSKEDFISKIKKFAQDKELRLETSKNAIESAKKFSTEKMIEGHINLYESII